jgi:hypothetical protein
MTPHAVVVEAEMWGRYRFHGFVVEVIQRWTDPYGRPHVRVQTVNGAADHAEGMLEEAFLRDAVPIAAAAG